MIKISIVTISYNQAKYLETAILSVIGQDYDNLEYIIVDPGSTDGSRDIIENYADRIHKIILEPDNGPADGLNKGFAQATGDVFGYINADDILLPGALSKVAQYFDTHKDMDVLLGNGLQLDSNGNVKGKLFSSKWDLRRHAYGACNIVQQSTFFRKYAFERSGGFNIQNRTCWDAELLVDMSMLGARFLKVEDFLGGFRFHSGSTSRLGTLEELFRKDRLRIFNKIMGRERNSIDELKSFYYRLVRKLSLSGARKVS